MFDDPKDFPAMTTEHSAYKSRARAGKLTKDEITILVGRFQQVVHLYPVLPPSVDSTYAYAAQKRDSFKLLKKNKGKTPRPLHKFILFCWRFLDEVPIFAICDVPEMAKMYQHKLAGVAWRWAKTTSDVSGWTTLANLLKAQQQEVYPGYVFVKSVSKKKGPKSSGNEDDEEEDEDEGDDIEAFEAVFDPDDQTVPEPEPPLPVVHSPKRARVR